MAVTIQDVARAAGVSLATVSRVLNDAPTVGADLRKRVLTAVEELGYTPNENARRLSGGKSALVGLAMPDLGENASGYLHAFMSGVEERGYRVMIATSGDGSVPDREMISTIYESNIGGLVYVRDRPGGRPMQIISTVSVPIVYVGGDVSSGYVVNFDESAAAETLIAALPSERSVAMLIGDPEHSGLRRRTLSIRDALVRHGFDPGPGDEPYGVTCDGTLDGGYTAMQRLLANGDPPDIVLAVTDVAAIGALRAAYERGYAVPGDFSITGFGGSIYSESCLPPLTTVAFDYAGLGSVSAETIVDLMEARTPQRRQRVGFTLRPGASALLAEKRRPERQGGGNGVD